MSIELEPCPFCGSKDLTRQISTPDREGVPTNVLCMDCGASGPWTYVSPSQLEQYENTDEIPNEVIHLWNDRVSENN